MKIRLWLSTAIVVALPAFGGAQTPALDRTAIPTPGPLPQLNVPAWTETMLPNGVKLVVSEKHALPLVSFRLNFVGGTTQFEPADRAGLADLVTRMMLEGTTTRSGNRLATDLQLLGTSLDLSIAQESGVLAFQATSDKFQPALALAADVLLHPTFPAPALERLRGQALVSLTQMRDRTGGIASMVYPKILYGAQHPYGRMTTERTLNAVTRAEVVNFHRAYFQPARAIVTVVGDVNPDSVKIAFEKAFAGWSAKGSPATFAYPAAPASAARTIYIVDKPGAEQSTFAIGTVGPPRSTPDYYAIRVMNEMLGVLFQSRLNHNIREEKGYSYGVFSNFAFGRGPGPFMAMGDIVTAKSDSALIEFMHELEDIRGKRPPTEDELAQAKASLVQSLPASFASVAGVNRSIASIYLQDLPRDYYQQFAKAVTAVTGEEVVRVARQYIDPQHFSILIVGDKKRIEAGLVATKIAPIVELNDRGERVNAGAVTP
jgi:zinc protease